jgi:hypothetical protein
MDNLWTNTVNYGNYANITGPLTRIYPTTAIDPALNFPPTDDGSQDFYARTAFEMNHESQKIDIIMYRITNDRYTNDTVNAVNRGVPVRLLTEQDEYRNPARQWDSYNVDLMYNAGVQIRLRNHQGLNHEKVVMLYGKGETIFGSSNWTGPSSNCQQENNYFTTKPWFFNWFVSQFDRKWNSNSETKPFVPLPPDQPAYQSPADNATGLQTSVTLTWEGGPWAHKFDIYFGTNPTPPLLAADQFIGRVDNGAPETYALQTLQPGTKYYWRIVSKTMANVTASGPTRSFTTAGVPGAAPTVSSISPNSGTTSGGTSVTITGTNFSSGATVTIGGAAATSVNVVSSTSITAVTPAHAAGAANVVVRNTDNQTATLANGFTYTTPPPPPPPAAGEVVLYASEAPVRVGNWQVVADSSAAGGNRIFNPDAGLAKVVTPAANPTSYFEMTFPAQAGTPYHLWLRSKALNDSPFNDSVHIQFSDSVDSGGTAIARIGTTTSTEMNLEECSGCGLSGWGWGDNGWGAVGALGQNIYFQGSGQHTIRVQVREDGISIDQIVMSPVTYLSTAPGPSKNDNTILPKPGNPPPPPAPTISGINPTSGSTSGGTSVTISGSNFASGASVSIGGVAATSVTAVNSTTITATTGAHAAGAVNVVVTNSDGQSATLAGGYTYISASVVPSLGHVFIVVEENHGYSSVIGSPSMPYLNSLASRYGLATAYYANTHPSIGNYFWLTTGQGITNDSNFAGTVSADNIVRQLVSAGKTWKSYAESLPSTGYTGGDQYPYVKRHNPFAYITDVINSPTQVNNLVPFSQFGADLSSNQLPNYSFIIPNQFDNAHDCPAAIPSCVDADKLASADNWLSTNIAPLLASPVFQQDGLLIILFDESVDTDTTNGGGQVATLIISPRAKPGFRSAILYQHQSVLRMTAEALGLTSFPGAASTAPNMLEFFDTSTSPSPAISAIVPNSGATTGGTSVTISGSGFSTGATVMIGGAAATNVNVTSSTSITATTPAHVAGAVDVVVTNTNGLRSTLSGGYTYTSSSPGETILLADDFNDNSLNTSKWTASNLFSGFTDSSLPTSEINQRLEIGPLLQQTAGSHYNGIKSAASLNFTNAYCYVEVAQAAATNTSADAMLTLGKDVDNFYRIYAEAGTLFISKKIATAKATMLTVSYSGVSQRYWRIRHDSASNRVVFEVAGDNGGVPGSWTQLYSEVWNSGAVPLGAVQVELKAGTWQVEANAGGKVFFDNFRAAKP